MILILIGNKKGKGNGRRAVLEYPSGFIPSDSTDKQFFEQFNELADNNVKIRIQIGQEWTCKYCKATIITAANASNCPACKKRKPHVTGEVFKTASGRIDFDKTLGTDFDTQMKSDMIEAGYCIRCYRKLTECQCEV